MAEPRPTVGVPVVWYRVTDPPHPDRVREAAVSALLLDWEGEAYVVRLLREETRRLWRASAPEAKRFVIEPFDPGA